MVETPELRERMRRVRILIDALDDVVYPSTPVSRGSESGPAPGTRVPCRDCRRYRGRICPVCDGYGWKKRTSSDHWWDEYVNERVVSVAQKTDPKVHHAPSRPKKFRRPSPQENWDWDRFDNVGSFRELRRVLALIPPADSDEMVALAAKMMRGPIIVPRWLDDPSERKQTVARLDALGWSPSRIASALGLSLLQIKRLRASVRRG